MALCTSRDLDGPRGPQPPGRPRRRDANESLEQAGPIARALPARPDPAGEAVASEKDKGDGFGIGSKVRVGPGGGEVLTGVLAEGRARVTWGLGTERR